MKQILTIIIAALLFASCKTEHKNIVSQSFIDSLITNYQTVAEIEAATTEISFWKNRIDPQNPGLTNELKLAEALINRFHLTGDIQDVLTADSILLVADRAFNHKETAPIMALVRNSILQHRFKAADSLFEYAKQFDLKKYDAAATGFDVAFELSNYLLAESALKNIADYRDYGYNFRKAKLAHYKAEMDTAIAAMHRAVLFSDNNTKLKQAALSNEADLNLHNADLQKANDLYMESIRISASDLHSLLGLGWIALVHDNNDSLAEKIFLFVQTKTKAPDVLYKLALAADKRGDNALYKKYATAFEKTVTATAYGNMYNKYLIELYSGILQQPAKAEALAKKELLNRNTPQTNAWYVWALYCNNNVAEAEKVYADRVSGKPLEGLELYWMGKFMQARDKGYNAQQFFKAAYKNRYDLSPSIVEDLEEGMKD